MLKNKQQAKKHGYIAAASHVRSLAVGIKAHADSEEQKGEMQAQQADSERRLAEALQEIADSLEYRGMQMREVYVPSKLDPKNNAQNLSR